MTKTQIAIVAEEAAKLLKENPDWSYTKAIKKAKEMILHEDSKVDMVKKAN